MKYSHQKQTLIDILKNSEKHYSTEQIHNKLKKVIPNVSLMTVYRNLNKLVKEGVVLPFHIDNVMHFCGNNKQHFHMHCVDCGKVVDGYRTEINNAVESAINKDFYPLSNGMVIRGFCGNCCPVTLKRKNTNGGPPSDVGYRFGVVSKKQFS